MPKLMVSPLGNAFHKEIDVKVPKGYEGGKGSARTVELSGKGMKQQRPK